MAQLVYGLVGHPVAHSLSPAMQNAAFAELGIDAVYRLFDVPPDALEGFLAGADAAGLAGFNITIPHKLAAKKYIAAHGSLDENARRLGAVNTVKVSKGTLTGFNTDGPGFYRSLVEDLGFEPEGRRIFVLGAGGAATAVVMYLGNGPKEIMVADVDQTKTAALAAQYRRYYDAARLVVAPVEEIARYLAGADLFINTTPVGMHDTDGLPVDPRLLHPGLAVYDLVYNRPLTPLVREATKLKLRAATGLGMLLYQGAIAFELWTGKKPPLAVMKRELKKALTG